MWLQWKTQIPVIGNWIVLTNVPAGFMIYKPASLTSLQLQQIPPLLKIQYRRSQRSIYNKFSHTLFIAWALIVGFFETRRKWASVSCYHNRKLRFSGYQWSVSVSNITWLNNAVHRSKNPHCLSRLFSLDRLVVHLIMLEDEESQTHLEPLERESAEEWRASTGRSAGRCEV